MKPILLEIEGFNSFEKKQIIDFEKLTSFGLFGIFGKTGSGKTSILDAIIYALYADMPRGTSNMVNIACKKASVRYVFQMKGSNQGVYEIQRSVNKTKTEDERILSKISSAGKKNRISKLENGEYIPLADSKKEVDEKVKEIIGLEYQDFIKTVVLPQGQFSSFLKEKNKDRKEILERLFSLQKYGDELTDKIRSYRQRYEEIQRDYQKELSGYEGVDTKSVAELESKYESLKVQISKLNKQNDDYNTLQNEIKLLKKLELDMKIGQKEIDELLLRENDIKNLKIKVEKLEKIAGIQETIKLYSSAKANLPDIDKNIKSISDNISALQEKKASLDTKKIQIDEKINNIPNLQKEVDDLKNVIDVKGQIQEINKQIQQNENESTKVKKMIESLEQQVKQNDDALKKIDEETSKLSKIIQENTYKADYKQKSRVVQLDIKQMNKNLQDIQEMEKDTKKMSLQREEINKQNASLGKELTKLQEEMQSFKSSEGEQVYTIEKYQQNNEMLRKLEKAKDVIDSCNKTIDTNKQILDENKTKLEQLNTELENKNLQKQDLQKKVQEQQKDDIVEKLKSSMKDNEECPVCGGVYHISKQDIQDISKDSSLSEYQIQLDEINSSITDINANISVLTLQNDKNEEENINISQKIKDVKSSFENKNIIVSEEIQKCVDYNQNYNDYQTKEKDRQSKQKQLETQISKISTDIQLNDNNIDNLSTLITSNIDKKTALEGINLKFNDKISQELKKLEIDIKEIDTICENIDKAEQIVEENTIKLDECNEKRKTASEKSEKDKTTLIEQKEELKNIDIKNINLNSQRDLMLSKVIDKTLLSLDDAQGVLNQKQEQIQNIQKSSLDVNKDIEQTTQRLNDENITLGKLNTSKEFYEKNKNDTAKTLNKFMEENGFKNSLDILKLNEEYDTLTEKQGQIQAYDTKLQQLQGVQKKIQLEHKEQISKIEKLENDNKYDEQEHIRVKEELNASMESLGSCGNKLSQEKLILEKKKDIIKKNEENNKILDEVNEIDKLFKGKAFVQFLSKFQLSYVCQRATDILKQISSGAYAISIDEDGGFIVSDYKNGGIIREPSTLSGGETFLVSLSLALALSSQIQLKGNAPLEFFFMDEGFGTLDTQTLDTALQCLKNLKSDNLSIGIISHLDKIKEFVPIKLEITQDKMLNTGSSVKIITG